MRFNFSPHRSIISNTKLTQPNKSTSIPRNTNNSIDHQMEDNPQRNQKRMLMTRLMSNRTAWAILVLLVYALILSSSWNLLRSILRWYGSTLATPSPASGVWPAVYASAMLGAVFGMVSIAAAAALAVPAMLVMWITVLVLLACCGRQRRDLVVEGKKLTSEICRSVFRTLIIKEGNLLAAAFAVVGYLLLVMRGTGNVGGGFTLAVD